ncbi:MAG: ATP-binding protein [Actinomycetota bacterium]|nr:ATP-binding protein [Actinomycetota bacterium]
MTTSVRFVIPAKREFVGLVRLAIGGLAPAMPFDADTVEDMKLVMSEICTNIVLGVSEYAAPPPPELAFTVTLNPSDVTIEIDSSEAVDELMLATSAEWTKPKQSGYGLSIITALMDNVELIPGGDHRSILRLKKFT